MAKRKTLDEYIAEDLAIYDQEHIPPKSLTKRNGEYFRHYELGEVRGFMVWNEFDNDGKQWFGIMSIEEDDGFYSPASHALYVSAFWVNTIGKAWDRMRAWINEHLDLSECKIIKEFGND